jgi:hypothetical protein
MSKLDQKELRKANRKLQQDKLLYGNRLFRHLYRGLDGIAVSNAARAALESDDKSLTYGEVTFPSFIQILDFVNRMRSVEEAEFVDLGCGTGKAIITAALSPLGFSKVWGIEIVPDLVVSAQHVFGKLLEYTTLPSSEVPPASESHITVVTKTRSTLPKPNKQAAPSPPSDQVITFISDLIRNNKNTTGVEPDFIASKLSEHFGSKSYKAFIKKFGSFSKFLVAHCSIFQIAEDGSVTLAGGETAEPSGAGSSDIVEPDAAISRDIFDTLDAITCRNIFLHLPAISIVCGSIFDVDWWSTADVVYVASLLFSDVMMHDLGQRCLKMKEGSIVISLKRIEVNVDTEESLKKGLTLLSESFFRMSWQMACVYIYQVTNRVVHNDVELNPKIGTL